MVVAAGNRREMMVCGLDGWGTELAMKRIPYNTLDLPARKSPESPMAPAMFLSEPYRAASRLALCSYGRDRPKARHKLRPDLPIRLRRTVGDATMPREINEEQEQELSGADSDPVLVTAMYAGSQDEAERCRDLLMENG